MSRGPGAASGWNCTEKNGLLLCAMPSFELSLALTYSGSQSLGSVSCWTA